MILSRPPSQSPSKILIGRYIARAARHVSTIFLFFLLLLLFLNWPLFFSGGKAASLAPIYIYIYIYVSGRRGLETYVRKIG
jgi:hypothetical protein